MVVKRLTHDTISTDKVARLAVDVDQVCTRIRHDILLRVRQRSLDSPTCSGPLNTYSLQFLVGFLASGGSLYFKTTPVTAG